MGEAQQPQRQQALDSATPAAETPKGTPLSPTYQQVLALQRSAGNGAVARALAAGRPAGVGVRPSNQLWYFNGAQQREHPTEIKLSADAPTVGRLVWDVVEGQDRIELTGSGGPSHAESQTEAGVNVLSRSGSKGEDDVRVRVQQFGADGALLGVGEERLGVRTPAGTVPAGRTSAPTPVARPIGGDGPAQGTGLEERDENGEIAGGGGAQPTAGGEAAAPAGAPKSLRHDGTSHQADPTWAYETHESYTVLDDKGTPIKGFDVNEKFGAPSYDASGADWRQSQEGGYHSGTTTFYDQMGGESSGHTPAPQSPQSPLGTTKVQHWNQSWYIGSVTPGQGTLVQTNVFQKYRDHAAHENIKSPP